MYSRVLVAIICKNVVVFNHIWQCMHRNKVALHNCRSFGYRISTRLVPFRRNSSNVFLLEDNGLFCLYFSFIVHQNHLWWTFLLEINLLLRLLMLLQILGISLIISLFLYFMLLHLHLRLIWILSRIQLCLCHRYHSSQGQVAIIATRSVV